MFFMHDLSKYANRYPGGEAKSFMVKVKKNKTHLNFNKLQRSLTRLSDQFI